MLDNYNMPGTWRFTDSARICSPCQTAYRDRKQTRLQIPWRPAGGAQRTEKAPCCFPDPSPSGQPLRGVQTNTDYWHPQTCHHAVRIKRDAAPKHKKGKKVTNGKERKNYSD